MYNLKLRHTREKPYTRTGDIVIAVNPYQWYHELYTEEKRFYYANRLLWENSNEDPRATMEPHVYEVSALAYKGLAMGEDHEDQSILVSGESGAGKTETVKICLNHIASVQRGQVPPGYYGSSDYDPIVQRVVQSNPLLEAFGNAQTRRNDNSSRFGKYLQLQFDKDASKSVTSLQSKRYGLVGSKCDVYLLEKNRVVSHDRNERNFHIFYQLLAASDQDKTKFWSGLRGTNNDSFKYVGATKTTTIEGKSDAVRFDETLRALELVNVTGTKLQSLMQAICITMQLGNMGFQEDPNDSDQSMISTSTELSALSALMGVSAQTLTASFTERTFKTAKESHKVPLRAVAAQEACDALAKEIYQKAFLWLVSEINNATGADASKSYGTIGLLDIFGFESFTVNRFEQLCINYANEKLQQKFTEDVFANVKAEYESEGIPLVDVWYDDNTDVLDLIEGRTGLLNLLNEECVRPKGSDFDFVQKSLQINKASPALTIHRTDRLSFGIRHYAGQVMYDAEFFVTKNLDTLPTDLQDCAEQCTNPIVSSPRIEQSSNTPRTSNAQSNINAPTVWSKYKTQLSALMGSLRRTKSRYIRCIKPNGEKLPAVMDHKLTVEQLRCAGVIAGITISRSCFPNRLPNSLVLARYSNLFDTKNFPSRKTSDMSPDKKRSEDCKALLNAALLSQATKAENGTTIKAFAVGKTKAYFRAGALEFLESRRMTGLDSQAISIQRAARGWLARNKGQYTNQRQKMEEAMRRAMEQDEAERKAQLARDAEKRASHQREKMQEMFAECEAMELEMRKADEENARALKCASDKAAKCKQELAEIAEKLKADEDEGIHKRAGEKAAQDKQLEEAIKLINYLKRENQKARKEQEKIQAKLNGVTETNEVLGDSVRDFSEGCNFAEELALMEQSSNDVMMIDYESSKALNKELKGRFRTQQSMYLDVAHSRLELQKTLKTIMTIIDESKNKPNHIIDELNSLVAGVEATAKAEMLALEAQFSNDGTGEYSETEF